MADASLKLIYFKGKGRAEMARLLLAAAGKQYEDARLSQDEWKEQFKQRSPFGGAPCLEVNGKMYGQSMAVSTFLAKEFGFYGSSNTDGLVIDGVLQSIQDIMQIAVKFMFEKDEGKKQELATAFKDTETPRFFGYYEALLKENGTGYFVGSKLSLADIAVYDLFTGMMAPRLGSVDSFPLLKALVDKVGADQKIKAYMASRPDTPF
ncbi:glutathione S-transferase 1 [Aplysia californica]|uniref:Glutathione S-transferase 1 n=1 Tax=Aplysia californica TaxID=6500 RepID=A0ABM0K1Q0_APLCA|nr:glutathione S-transferase 1 [Aplysia californica]